MVLVVSLFRGSTSVDFRNGVSLGLGFLFVRFGRARGEGRRGGCRFSWSGSLFGRVCIRVLVR